MQSFSLEEIIEYAKNYSPYYKELYQGINSKQLSDLPIVDQKKFWSSDVLTSKNPSGIVFKSGGSTGNPKHSYFTNSEWDSFTKIFGWGMSKGILAPHDKVANLFYGGDMYASFFFIKDSLASIDDVVLPLTHYPLSGGIDHDKILHTLEEFNINVLLGVPSAILSLLNKYAFNRTLYPKIKIEKILFGGEGLYPDQEKSIQEILTDVAISSIGIASVDGGLLGFIDKTCLNNEHRVFDKYTIIEIIDPDTNEVILEKNRIGKVLLTNLTRKLMPIIRFPAGDMAMWTEDAGVINRKFSLTGRADEAARLGTLTIGFEEIRNLIQNSIPKIITFQFQMEVKHFNHLDELTLKIALSENIDELVLQKNILEKFKEEKLDYKDVIAKKLIHPLKIEFKKMGALETNTRTGKLKRIVDNRAKI